MNCRQGNEEGQSAALSIPLATLESLVGGFLASRLLCAFLGTAGVMAGQGTQPWNQPRFSDDVAAVYQAASSVTSTKGSEVVVLFEENTFTFDVDGRCVHTKYSIYKVLSEKGAGGWDNVDVEWEPWHEEKPVLRARVIGADQVSHPLDAKTITDSPASDDNDNEYGDRRVVRAPFPAIAQGAVVEEEITVRETAPLFAAGVVRRVYFGSSSPVSETRLTLDAPSSLNLKYNA